MDNASSDAAGSVPPPPPLPPPPPKPEDSNNEQPVAAPLPPPSQLEPEAAGSAAEPASAVPADPDPTVALAETRAYKGQTLDKTAKFEQQRKEYFTTLYENNQLYWQSFVELIQRNQTSNEKTIAFLTAKIASARAYSNSLYGIRDTVAGNKSGTTAAVREKERAGVRRTAGSRGRSSTGMLSRGTSADAVPGRAASALEHMFDMEEKTAMMLHTFCDEIETDVLQKMLQAMAADIGAQFQIMVSTGSACLKVLAQYEANSSAAHDALRTALIASVSTPMPGSAAALAALQEVEHNANNVTGGADVWVLDMGYRVAVSQQLAVSDAASAQLGTLFGRMKDLEVSRRLAIRNALLSVLQSQDLVWRQLPVLKDPVLQVLERINTDRRFLDTEIREAMRTGAAKIRSSAPVTASATATAAATGSTAGTAAARAGALASSGHSTAGSAAGGDGTASAAGSRRTSRSSTVDLDDSSHSTADAAANADSAADGSSSNSSSSGGDALLGRDSPTRSLLQQLESPLSSQLIRKIGLVERKKDTMLTRWQPCLAVITADGWLHLFDLPHTSKVAQARRSSGAGLTGSHTPPAAIEEAFKDIVPLIKVDEAIAAVAKGRDAKSVLISQRVYPPVPPSITVDLTIVEAQLHEPAAGDAGGAAAGGTFEVTELVRNRGVKKMFHDFTKRKVLLRGAYKAEVTEWAAAINTAGREGMTQARSEGAMK